MLSEVNVFVMPRHNEFLDIALSEYLHSSSLAKASEKRLGFKPDKVDCVCLVPVGKNSQTVGKYMEEQGVQKLQVCLKFEMRVLFRDMELLEMRRTS